MIATSLEEKFVEFKNLSNFRKTDKPSELWLYAYPPANTFKREIKASCHHLNARFVMDVRARFAIEIFFSFLSHLHRCDVVCQRTEQNRVSDKTKATKWFQIKKKASKIANKTYITHAWLHPCTKHISTNMTQKSSIKITWFSYFFHSEGQKRSSSSVFSSLS